MQSAHEDKAHEVQEFYKKYPFPNDSARSIEDVMRHHWILNCIPRPLIPHAPCTIADIGCGTGEIACMLSRYGKVTGFDFSTESLKRARLLAKKLGREITFVQSDMTEEKDRGVYDYLFSIGVLHHIPQVRKAFANIRSMMHPKSIFVVSVYNKWAYFFKGRENSRMENESRYMDEYHHPFERFNSRREFKRMLQKEGFEIIGEWRKMPDFVRLLTGKGAMMTFCVRLRQPQQQ